MRPANLVTSVADVLAGATLSGFFESPGPGPFHIVATTLLLSLSTIGLYGGGGVFNDVFGAALDAVEGPERPIPSGLIKPGEAATPGTLLLVAGTRATIRGPPVSGP